LPFEQTLFDQKPVAEMFHVVYLAEANEASLRPLTFVFTRPGAASAYLHMGARSEAHLFRCQRQPAQTSSTVVDNAESWLIFTDLVFIDPIGTGFSRSLPQDKDIQDKSGEKAN